MITFVEGPFLVGTVEADISDEEQTDFCDVQLFAPSFEDCLLFTLNGKAKIHKVDVGEDTTLLN